MRGQNGEVTSKATMEKNEVGNERLLGAGVPPAFAVGLPINSERDRLVGPQPWSRLVDHYEEVTTNVGPYEMRQDVRAGPI